MSKMQSKTRVVIDHMRKYNGLSKREISRAVYKKYPHLFKDEEAVRSVIRYYTDSNGKKNKQKSKPVAKDYELNEAIMQRWGLKESKAKGREVFNLPSSIKNAVVISDIHFPQHDVHSIGVAMTYAEDIKADAIIINGDLLDNTPFTRFTVPPDLKNAKEYFDQAYDFLAAIRSNLPKTEIIFMYGNHDNWYVQWLMTKCAEVFDDNYFHLEQRLDFDTLKVRSLKDNVILQAGDLAVIHGHTIMRGAFSPVSAARSAFMKSFCNLLIGHTHQIGTYESLDIYRNVMSTVYTTGCLSTTSPSYDPHTIKHKNGFAHLVINNGKTEVNNYEIKGFDLKRW